MDRTYVNFGQDRCVAAKHSDVSREWLSQGSSKQNYKRMMVFGGICRGKKLHLARFDIIGEGEDRGKVNTDNYIQVLSDFFDESNWNRSDILMYDA